MQTPVTKRIQRSMHVPMRHRRLHGLLQAAALLVLCGVASAQARMPDQARWQQQAKAVTITRDDWGIAHVHGKTDADAVFGMIYAQAEDDFNRVETNYLDRARPHSPRPRARARSGRICASGCSSIRPSCKAHYASSPRLAAER